MQSIKHARRCVRCNILWNLYNEGEPAGVLLGEIRMFHMRETCKRSLTEQMLEASLCSAYLPYTMYNYYTLLDHHWDSFTCRGIIPWINSLHLSMICEPRCCRDCCPYTHSICRKCRIPVSIQVPLQIRKHQRRHTFKHRSQRWEYNPFRTSFRYLCDNIQRTH